MQSWRAISSPVEQYHHTHSVLVSDSLPQSQRRLPDKLQGRVQILRRAVRLSKAREVPGGHCVLRGGEGAGANGTGGPQGDGHLQRDLHPHIGYADRIAEGSGVLQTSYTLQVILARNFRSFSM